MSNKSEEVEWGWGLGGKQYLKNIFVNKGGLTKEDLWRMFSTQGECCGACRKQLAWPLEKRKRMGEPFEIDHEHLPGEKRCTDKRRVRGILCQSCNKALREVTKRIIPADIKTGLDAYLARYELTKEY